MRCRAAVAVALAAAVGCVEVDTAKPPTTTEATTTTTTFAEPQSAPAPVPTAAPPPTEQPAATTIPVGLPSSLAVLPADVITISGDSGSSMRQTVRGVPLDEVQAFVVAELTDLGWEVAAPVTEADGSRTIAFLGPGAAGTAHLTVDAPDFVDIFVELGPRPS